MNCKNCGVEVPAPEPKVVERIVKVEVEVGEGAFWIRQWRNGALAVVLVAAILSGARCVSDFIESLTMKRIIEDKSIRIEITERDRNDKEVKKIVREPQK